MLVKNTNYGGDFAIIFVVLKISQHYKFSSMPRLFLLLLFLVSGSIFISCSSSQQGADETKQAQVETRPDLEKILKETQYKRYVLFKGDNLSDVEKALKVRATIYNMDWKVREARYKDWVLVELLEVDESTETTDYHDLACWFFGETGEPIENNLNEGSVGISVAVDPKGTNTYICYMNKQILDNAEETCDMYAVFQNNEKGIASACFDIVRSARGYDIPDFNTALKQFEVDLEELARIASSGKVLHVKSK